MRQGDHTLASVRDFTRARCCRYVKTQVLRPKDRSLWLSYLANLQLSLAAVVLHTYGPTGTAF
jgi:hypothetical protein